MIQNFRWFKFFIIIVSLATGCGKTHPDLEGVDLTNWKEDRNGCEMLRTTMIDSIRSQKNKLLGFSEMEIIDILGKPDENELYKRNQKFYHYYLQPSTACESPTPHPLKLTIRFNAMGLAKEIAIE